MVDKIPKPLYATPIKYFCKEGCGFFMPDNQQQMDYWRSGADDDLEAAEQLVQLGKVRHGLFFAHLCLEKLLKAHICCTTQNHPPRIHNLVRLAERSING